MANKLRYTYQVLGADSSAITFDDVDGAKDIVDFSECDFTGLSPVYSLEDSDTTLVLTIPFADTADGRTAQDAFHNNMKDTWSVTATLTGEKETDVTWAAEMLNPSDAFTVTTIRDGEVDIE